MAPRPNPPVIHMIVAMLVVLVPILLITWFFTDIPEPKPQAVDCAPVIKTAGQEASYDVWALPTTPEGWTCTRARWIKRGQPGPNHEPVLGDTFQLGYVNDKGRYLAVDQRDIAPEKLIADITRQGNAVGASEAKGAPWTRYESADGRTKSLVSLEGQNVTIVSGDVPHEELEAFVAQMKAS